MSDSWDPGRYQQFAAERAQPFWDLIELVEARLQGAPRRMFDLGCGPGELTAAAAERLGAEHTVGIDSSVAMLNAARNLERGGLSFEHGDLAAWARPNDVDVVLANASLQWVHDHPGVLGRLARSLAPGGVLGVQVPVNADHPSHTVANEVALRAPFVHALGGEVPPDHVANTVLRPEDYALLLVDLGLEQVHVRLQVYLHLLPSSTHLVEWMRGTALTRFASRLPSEVYEAFVAAYTDRLLEVVGDVSPYVFAFKRVLMVAVRPA